MNKAGKKYIGNVNPQHAMAIEAIEASNQKARRDARNKALEEAADHVERLALRVVLRGRLDPVVGRTVGDVLMHTADGIRALIEGEGK